EGALARCLLNAQVLCHLSLPSVTPGPACQPAGGLGAPAAGAQPAPMHGTPLRPIPSHSAHLPSRTDLRLPGTRGAKATDLLRATCCGLREGINCCDNFSSRRGLPAIPG